MRRGPRRPSKREVNAALAWLATLRQEGPQPAEGSLTAPCPECMHRMGCKQRLCQHPEACICRGPSCDKCRQESLPL